MDVEWVAHVTAAAAAVTWFHLWCAGVVCSLLVDLLHRGLMETRRARLYLTLGWDCIILGVHLVTEDYRWIFLGHACKIVYMILSRPRDAAKIAQIDAYYVMAFFVVVHGGAQLELETFDVMSWELRFHCLTLLYNAIFLVGAGDRPVYVFGLTGVWFLVRVLAFAWASGRNLYYAAVVLSQVAAVAALITTKG
jgi:hypothetical protein